MVDGSCGKRSNITQPPISIQLPRAIYFLFWLPLIFVCFLTVRIRYYIGARLLGLTETLATWLERFVLPALACTACIVVYSVALNLVPLAHSVGLLIPPAFAPHDYHVKSKIALTSPGLKGVACAVFQSVVRHAGSPRGARAPVMASKATGLPKYRPSLGLCGLQTLLVHWFPVLHCSWLMQLNRLRLALPCMQFYPLGSYRSPHYNISIEMMPCCSTFFRCTSRDVEAILPCWLRWSSFSAYNLRHM